MSYPVLSDFTDKVKFNLGNRSNIDDRIRNWLVDAYREIAMGYPLETLELSVVSSTVQDIDAYDYPDDARAIKALTITNNNSPVPLIPKNIQVIRRYQVTTTGVPAIWCGWQNQMLLRAVPNGAYPLYIDYWQKPVVDETDSDTIDATSIQLPDDWFEILVQAATQKGHSDLQEKDKAMALRQLLNGDPDSSKGFPGMIKERLTRNAAESSMSNYGMRPRIRRYTSGR